MTFMFYLSAGVKQVIVQKQTKYLFFTEIIRRPKYL